MITGIDVWEGSLDINESIILEAGVKFVFIRLNDMNGGHHPDANFTTEWEQCESFLRAPYFVYNPWVSGKVNAEFLLDTIPTEEVTKVMDDIEVVKKDYPAADYAREVANYYLITSRYRYTHVLYTGQWFLGNLSYWPTNVDYCWARYPNYLYPDGRIEITWADLNTRLVTYGWNPDPQKRCPGPLKGWQCSADRYILPGCANRPMDIIEWNDTLINLQTWWGSLLPQITLEQRVAALEADVARLKLQAIAHGWTI